MTMNASSAGLIEALGGASKTADALAELRPVDGQGQPIERDQLRERLYVWKTQSHIPHWARPYMRLLARRADLPIPEDIQDPGEKLESSAA